MNARFPCFALFVFLAGCDEPIKTTNWQTYTIPDVTQAHEFTLKSLATNCLTLEVRVSGGLEGDSASLASPSWSEGLHFTNQVAATQGPRDQYTNSAFFIYTPKEVTGGTLEIRYAFRDGSEWDF